MDAHLKARLITRACDIAGGRERLASRLGVEVHSLEFWLSGRATPPEAVFLKAVDLVLDDDLARAKQDRRKNAVQRTVFGPWSERNDTVDGDASPGV
jgi:hypothetical protein